jgi:hypothetical protein
MFGERFFLVVMIRKIAKLGFVAIVIGLIAAHFRQSETVDEPSYPTASTTDVSETTDYTTEATEDTTVDVTEEAEETEVEEEEEE